jgi:hypothetical protein
MGHFGSKENHRDKGKKRTELISVIRDEHKIVIEYDLFQRNVQLIVGKRIDLILDVEHDKDEQYQSDREEKRFHEFPEYVSI